MSFPSAAAFLVGASLRNRLRRFIKQPRNVLFTLAAVAYITMLRGDRHLGAMGGALTRTSGSLPVSPWLALLVLGYLAFVWLFGADDAVLAFSEAEVDFLFTAPVTRRRLVHYKLVRTLLTSFVTGAFLACVLGRGGHSVYAMVGLCIAYTTISFHRVCASMTRASLLAHGVSGLKRRIVTLMILGAALGAVGVSIGRSVGDTASLDASSPGALLHAASAWADAHPQALSWMFFPITAMVRVVSATSAAEFLGVLPVALGLLAIHYVWALSTDVAFEEASAESAKKLALRVDEARAGRLGVGIRTPPLFRLGSLGRPWVAIFWKNLIAGMRLSRRQLVAVSIIFVVTPTAMLASLGPHWREAAGPAAVALSMAVALLGPQILLNDLRQDVEQIDALRSYPLTARQTVLGELLAPLAMLCVLELVALVVAIGFGLAQHDLDLCLTALACIFPLQAITACALLLRNVGALWFPSWAGASGRTVRGIEAFGQRLLVVFGTLAALAVVTLPAAAVAGGLSVLLWSALGSVVLPFAGLLGGAVAFLEVYGGLALTARVLERFDATSR